jgi:hypothetical protein
MTGEQVLKIRDQLRSVRNALQGHWDDLSQLYMPFRLSTSEMPDIPPAENSNDSTGRDVALILANGLASLVIPREEIWHELMPPREFAKDDKWVRAYRNASVTMREYLERSNFYEEAQELLIQNPVFGTGCMFVGDVEDDDVLYFRHQCIGTYDIAEDARGRVNTVGRDLRLTPDQAALEFGLKDLPKNIAGKVGKPEGMTEKGTYYHLVIPASERAAADAPESDKKPYRSYVVEEVSRKIVQQGGHDEFPFAVPRYRKYGSCVWGFGPGTTGIADARQLDFLEKLADAAAEKAVFPPTVAPASLEGEIGQGALEITYVEKAEDAQILKEWAAGGRYDFAKDRLNDKRTQLRKVFHVDLFQLFSARAMERAPMTATEASLVSNEKLSQFSPVFGRLVSEFLTPVLTRVFGILLRKNAFGAEFAELVSERGVPMPSILYKNRIMLAMQQRANQSLMDFVGLVAPLIQADPTLMDPINGPQIIRDVARNAGFGEEWLRSPEAEKEIKQARAEAQQAAQQAELAATMAKAGKDVGQTPPDVRESLANLTN